MSSKCICRTAAVRRRRSRWICAISAFTVLIGGWCIGGNRPVSAQSQTFNSTSTGADGPLSVTAQGLTYFDPATIPNHHAGDTIFNFTTIDIAKGATLRLDSRNLPGPVYWLATGAVNIDGTLDLSGATGHLATGNRVDRVFSTPGAGGFGGGPGGGTAVAAEAGAGPGGGKAAATNTVPATAGSYSGSQYLIPLIGGSGGGGAFNSTVPFYIGGGAGGGAILIASSVAITISGTGQVNAEGGVPGGNVGSAGGGSGGAIRLMAPTITGGGLVDVRGAGNNPGSSGFIRLESFQTGLGVNPQGSYTTSMPLQVAIPATGPPVVKVTSVAGIAITQNPFSFPDVTIGTSNPVPVAIQAQNIPPGAIPTLTIVSETGPDQTITAPALQGTLQQSTSTVNITYPPGGSKGLVRVNWTD